MLDELQKAKLVAWAEWWLEHGGNPLSMPAGIAEVDEWACGLAPFPTFDRDEPYTFGEDHG